jgi:dTDP-4-amino-4,6-dideoxygalactose transaminase
VRETSSVDVAAAQAAERVKSVPFFGLDRQFRRYRETFLAITDQVLSSGQVLQGPAVDEFESLLCKLTGRRHAVAVGSCTDAIAFALAAGGIGPGDEVLVTPFSFVASVSPIFRLGARARFVDIDPNTFMMDVEQIERHISKATRAIIGVHLYGQALPIERLEAIAHHHGLLLIEDAAQGMGARYGKRLVGSMGRISCLSFDPTKVIGSFSSGGAVLTDDPTIARRIVMQRYHGRDPVSREYVTLGYNSQLSSEMAAMLAFKLSKMQEWEAERARIADIYYEGLSDLRQMLRLPYRDPNSTHNWHKFVIRVADRAQLMNALSRAGVQTLVHYPIAISDTPLLKDAPDAGKATEATRAAKEVLSLPIFAELEPAEARAVVRQIREYYLNDT